MAMELVPAPYGALRLPESLGNLSELYRLNVIRRFSLFESLWHSCGGPLILGNPSANGGLHQDEWPSPEGLKFTMAPSWNGGFDINIDSHIIRVPKYLRELRKAREDGATLDKGAPGSVFCEADDGKISKLSKKNNGAPRSEPDNTEWKQQQQQQGTFTGVNHVAEQCVLGPDASLSDASGGGSSACQGKIETGPINLLEDTVDSGSVICETDCKIISGLAAEEYLNEQHFMNDDGEHRQQRRNSVLDEQKRAGHHGEQEDHRAYLADEHATSIALKNTHPPATAWLIASAVPHHATGNRELLSGFARVHGDLRVKTGDAGAAPMRVVGTGNVVTDAVVLPDVWYVPGLVANVVSVSQLAELGYCVAFFGRGRQCYVRSAEDGVVVGEARAGEDGLFAFDFIRVPLVL